MWTRVRGGYECDGMGLDNIGVADWLMCLGEFKLRLDVQMEVVL